MHLTLIVTVDPVKDLSYLDLLVHALNLQTCRDFDVVFYNQTLLTTEEIRAGLKVRPKFPSRTFSVPAEDFLGSYPIWDLYGLHARLIDEEAVGDYVMALHMEEFPDADYVEHFLDVLRRERFDILFGNLSRTRSTPEDLERLLETETAEAFDRVVTEAGLKSSPHWSFDHRPVVQVLGRALPGQYWRIFQRWMHFGFRKRLLPTSPGFTKLRRDVSEDVFAMSVKFARRYNWFLSGHHLYFEDIHIFGNAAVGYLSEPLLRKTPYPVHFNRRRIYHLRHDKFYFQLEDDTFTSLMIDRTVEHPVLLALQHAIREYRAGRLALGDALLYSRRNHDGTGTQNLNYDLHMRYLANPPSPQDDPSV